MATTIASLAVQINANAQQFMGVVAATEQRMNKLAEVGRKVAPAIAAPFQSAAGVMSASVKAIVSPITGALDVVNTAFKGTVDLLKSIPIVGGAFAAIPTSLKGFIDLIKGELKEMVSLNKEAKRLGLTYQGLLGIQLALGGSVEDLEKGMLHMGKLLADAASGGQAAQMTLGRAGVNPAALAGKDMEEKLSVLSERFQSLTKDEDKAFFLFELFGKSGLKWFNLLSQGSEGLEKAKERLRALGANFSDLDMAGAQRAVKAMKEIDLGVAIIQRNLAVEFAPIIGTVAEGFAGWLKQVGGLRGAFHVAAEAVGKFIAFTLEGIADLIDGFDKLTSRADGIGNALAKLAISPGSLGAEAGSKLGRRLVNGEEGGGAPGAPGGPTSLGDSLRRQAGQFRNLRSFAEDALPKPRGNFFTNFLFGGGGEGLLNAGTQDLIHKFGELKEKLEAQVASFGGASEAVERMKLAHKGATPAMLATIDALIAEKTALERLTSWGVNGVNIFDDYNIRLRKLHEALLAGTIGAEGLGAAIVKLQDGMQKSIADKAESVFQSTRNPMEKFRAQIDELNQLFKQGAINRDTYLRASSNAAMELIKTRQMAEVRTPGAVQFGSQEAYKAIIQHERGDQGKDAVTILQEMAKHQLDADKLRAAQAERIIQAIKENRLLVGGGI